MSALLNVKCGAVFAAALLAALTAAAGAWAQSAGEAGSDFDSARSDALLGTSPAPAAGTGAGSLTSFSVPIGGPEHAPAATTKYWTLNGILPGNYYYKDTDGSPLQTAAETTPELKLGFSTKVDTLHLQVAGFLDAASDRYSRQATDGDKLDGQVKLTGLLPAAYHYWPTPYFYYAPAEAFDPFFKSGIKLTQDFVLGATELIDISELGTLVPRGLADHTTAPVEFGLGVSIQRRLVSKGADSTAVVISPSVKVTTINEALSWGWNPSNGTLAASLTFNVTRRLYDDVPTKGSEHVWGLQPIATVVWVLPSRWFAKHAALFGAPEIDFQAAYNSNQSTILTDTSRQWSVGPSFKGTWQF